MKTIVVFLRSGIGEIVPVLSRCLMLLPALTGKVLLGSQLSLCLVVCSPPPCCRTTLVSILVLHPPSRLSLPIHCCPIKVGMPGVLEVAAVVLRNLQWMGGVIVFACWAAFRKLVLAGLVVMVISMKRRGSYTLHDHRASISNSRYSN